MKDLPHVHFLLNDKVQYSVNQLHNGLKELGCKVTVWGGDGHRHKDRFGLKAPGKPVGLNDVTPWADSHGSPQVLVVEATDAKGSLMNWAELTRTNLSDYVIVVVDESEAFEHWAISRSALDYCDVYLKREWRWYHARLDDRIRHFPFSWTGWPSGVTPLTPTAARSPMVFFSGSLGYMRGAYLDAFFDHNVHAFVQATIQEECALWEEYLATCREYLVGLVVPGIHGVMQTMRMWEVPAVGVAPLIPYHDIGYPNPMVEDEHCAYYSTPSEAATKAAIMLAEPAHTIEMGLKAMALVQAKHTQRARAESVLEYLEEVRKW